VQAGFNGFRDRFRLAALFGFNAGVRAGGIDQRDDGEAELGRHLHQALRLAVAFRLGHAEVVFHTGYEYYDLVLAVTEELGVTDQILIKGKRSTDAVAAKFAEHPRNMMYMPIIDILKPQGRALFAEYQEKGIAPLAYEVCWNKYTPEVKECMDKVVAGGSKLWVNSLWASLCGGLDDDAAFGGDPAEVYGKLVDMGATMIQTDRPELLISYLRSRGLHN
jgi:glycerophosphoryl diester phosphodiesterase